LLGLGGLLPARLRTGGLLGLRLRLLRAQQALEEALRQHGFSG
jgi:hypothetical protein